MRYRRSRNGFSRQFNKDVGRFVYGVVYLLLFFISYKIWGANIFSEWWLFAANLIAYTLVGILLRAVGFWVY